MGWLQLLALSTAQTVFVFSDDTAGAILGQDPAVAAYTVQTQLMHDRSSSVQIELSAGLQE